MLTNDLTVSLSPQVPPVGSTVIAQAKASNGVVIKVVSNGVSYFLQAVNSIGNSIISKMINLVEAASLVSSFQSFARNVFSGMLNAAGQMLASALGDNSDKKIRELGIASYSLTALWFLVSTLSYVTAYFTFPLLGYSPETTKGALDFLFYTGFAIWPTLTLTTLGQFAYAYGSWKPSLVTSLMNRIPAIAGSYFLAITAGMGMTGIAVANMAAPWIVYLGMECWMRRQTAFSAIFKSDPANMPEFSEVLKQLKIMIVLSMKVGFQRCTEWLNALIITILLGVTSKDSLRSMNPGLNAISLWSLFSQGLGTGANMIVAKLIKLLEKAREDDVSPEEQAKIHAEIRSVILKSVIAGMMVNAIVGGAMYAAREPIVGWFIDNPSAETRRDAEILLGVVALGLIFDAPRIIVSTLLTAFGKPIGPNFAAAVLMSLGILASYLMSIKQDDSYKIISMFALRSGTIFLAALANMFTTYRSVQSLTDEIDKRLAAKSVAEAVREEPAALVNERDERAETAVPIPPEPVTVEPAKPNCFTRGYCWFFNMRYEDQPTPVTSPTVIASTL